MPDVVVVGAGAMGSAAAWQLALRGHDVVVLERFERGHTRGSSHGAARIFRLAYDQPDYVRLARAALPLWRELEAETATVLLTTTGGVDHGDRERLVDIAAVLDANAAPYSWLELDEAAERWTGLRFDRHVLHQPDAGRVDADAALRALQDAAVAHGADVRFSTPLRAIELRGDAVTVRTDDDEIHAAHAVVAVGAWARTVLADLVDLPSLEVTQEQPAQFSPRNADAQWPSFVHRTDDQLAAYGLASPGDGVKVGLHHTGPRIDPDRRDPTPHPALTGKLSAYVREWLPGLDPDPTSVTTCLYTNTPDEDFVIDRRGPLVVAAGFSGHGFKFTPAVGAMLADLVEGGEQALPRFRFRA